MKKLVIYISLLIICSVIFIPHSFADLSNNMTATATVLPRTADYQFNLGQEYGQANISQQTKYTYVITYGAQNSAYFPTSNTVITFNWANDLAPNNLHMFDYVLGSASYGYNGAPPVIDFTNRTITWIIPSMPAGTTDQKLYVVLYSNTYNIPNHPFSVTLSATMSNQYVTMPEQTLMQNYSYIPPLPGPTATPTPIIPTATPTPTPQPYQLTNVAFTNVSDNNAGVRINTYGPSKISVSFGTSPTELVQSISTNAYNYISNILLNHLLANTKYFIHITSTDQAGFYLISELFSFITAKSSVAVNLNNNIIVFSSNGHILTTNLQYQSTRSSPTVILTENSPYEITYKLDKQQVLQSIETVIINKILGQTTLAALQLPSELFIPMMQQSPNIYIATVNPLTTGDYEVDVRIVDENGNVEENKIADLRVIPHLTVYGQDTGKPLSDARVFLYYFDTQSNNYQPLSTQLFGNIQNPSYTNSLGQSMIMLPEGKYRVEESAFLYDASTADFIIGPESNQNFPILYLKRDPLNVISIGLFGKQYLSDTWSKITETLQVYAVSIRVFHLFAITILSSFVLMSFIFFLFRSHIRMKHVAVFLLFNMHKIVNKHQQFYLFGTVTNDLFMPITHALVEVEDAESKNIITQMNTNKAGRFYFRNSFTSSVNLLITKEGYEPQMQTTNMPNTGLHITLKKGEKHHKSFLAIYLRGLEEILGLLFEVSLVISIILEILFLSIYGWEKVLVYLILSFINIILWLFYLQEKSESPHLN